MIQTFNRLAEKVTSASEAGATAAVVLFVVLVFVTTRSLVKVLAVGITGAIVLFGVNNPTWFRDRVGEDIAEEEAMSVTVDAPAPLDLSDLGVVAS